MLHAAAAAGDGSTRSSCARPSKAHGLQRRIEGPDVAGRRVLAVEDTSTTGGSVLTAVEALRQAGAVVVGVAVIVDRGAGEAVRAAGLPYRAAYTLADLGLVAVKVCRFGPADMQAGRCCRWKDGIRGNCVGRNDHASDLAACRRADRTRRCRATRRGPQGARRPGPTEAAEPHPVGTGRRGLRLRPDRSARASPSRP